jgi:hypothetical protein
VTDPFGSLDVGEIEKATSMRGTLAHERVPGSVGRVRR